MTRAWVLGFGLVERTLENLRHGHLVPLARRRLVLLHPARAMNVMFWPARSDRKALSVVASVVVTGALTWMACAFAFDDPSQWTIAGVALLVVAVAGLVHVPADRRVLRILRAIGKGLLLLAGMGVCWLAARGAVAEAPRLAEAWQGCVDWLKALFRHGGA